MTPTSDVGLSEAEIKGYGVSLRIPLPKWGVTILALLLVAGLLSSGGYFGSTYLLNRVAVPKTELSVYTENNRHSLEPKEKKSETDFSFPDGTRVTVIHHLSDGCNQIVRWIPSLQKSDGLWMFGPQLTPEKQAGPAAFSARPVLAASVIPGLGLDFGPARASASGLPQGRCLDPHPGPYREQGEAAGQCVTKVWRHFQDGCFHYQFFNPCSGTWDVWPNGAPHVYWQRCIH